MRKLAVVAIGGNSLIRDKNHLKVEDQYQAITETTRHLVEIIECGYNIVVTHGNGPQVGFILRRSEIAYKYEGLHFVPLVSCVADTQGAIGYQIQQALNNEFKRRNIQRRAVTVVTQVKVDQNDPAFQKPSKPIGTFYTEEEERELSVTKPEWKMVEDAGRGFRRVVPSPKPLEIVEQQVISTLLEAQYCVIACGGGGIPVIDSGGGKLEGIDAVVDKDYASALVATKLNADILIISTSVDKILLNFGTPQQKPLDELTVQETKRYIEEGHFAEGSMLPKINAIVSFLENGGKKAIITRPENLKSALNGGSGTSILNNLLV